MSYVDDFLLAEQSQDGLTRKQNKKKINELLDKYGESREAINEHADIKDSFAYMFAKGDELIDEVLEERRKVRQNKELLHQLQMEDLARLKREKKEVSLEDIKDLELSAEQKANIQQLDHSNQLAMIKALRERQDIDNYQSHPSMAAMRREAKSLHEALLQKTKVDELLKPTKDKSSDDEKGGEISDFKLGELSSKYESLKDPSAIGYDNAGGYSYGVFQIETKHGTMKDYLSYLDSNKDYRNFAKMLQEAGGYQGALNKTDKFVNVWRELAKNEDFSQSQYHFIFDKKFKPLLNDVAKIDGFNLEKRHPVIKDVLFSMAVQHGQRGALQLIKNALENDIKNLDDESLINKLYDERSKVDKYLMGLPVEKRNSIKQNRYPNERKDALTVLKK